MEDKDALDARQQDQGEPNGTDWEAKYREAVKHSREWERRAKEYKPKAERWDEREQADKSELEKAVERAAKAEAELKSVKEDAQRQRLKSEVSEKTGVPASLLFGETQEELEARAEAISAYAKAQAPGYPKDKGGAAQSQGASVESIEKIKDPIARINARAANASLYRQ